MTAEWKTIDLEPCPFCGGSAKHYHRDDGSGWSNTDWVCCENEDCSCQTCLHETKEIAIAVWNRRANQEVRMSSKAYLTEKAAALAKFEAIASALEAANTSSDPAKALEQVAALHIARSRCVVAREEYERAFESWRFNGFPD